MSGNSFAQVKNSLYEALKNYSWWNIVIRLGKMHLSTEIYFASWNQNFQYKVK